MLLFGIRTCCGICCIRLYGRLFATRAGWINHLLIWVLLLRHVGAHLNCLLMRLEYLMLDACSMVAFWLRLVVWWLLRWRCIRLMRFGLSLNYRLWLAEHWDILVGVLVSNDIGHVEWRLVLSVGGTWPASECKFVRPTVSAVWLTGPCHWWKAILAQELWGSQWALQAWQGAFLAESINLSHGGDLLLWVLWVAGLGPCRLELRGCLLVSIL